MAMSEEERADLKKLTVDELIDVLDGYREDAERQRKADHAAIVHRFLTGDRVPQEEAREEPDPFDLSANEAFQRLKKNFS